MSSIRVLGGNKLEGQIEVQGSKNAALPILAASILNKGITKLKNCPRIYDVYNMIEALKYLGCTVVWNKDELIIDSSNKIKTEVSDEYVIKMRGSVLLLGALLGRANEVVIGYPGGCTIGKRPIDLHLDAFEKMNIENINMDEGRIKCRTSKILGAKIHLKFPSVGATQNIILASMFARGKTRISNAAREPEVQELCRCLVQAGAKIKGIGSHIIEVEGVTSLGNINHTLSPDRIVTGTYMVAVAITGGSVKFISPKVDELTSTISILEEVGCEFTAMDDGLRICCDRKLKLFKPIITSIYPGFPTDMQSQMISLSCFIQGETIIEEKIFESRFQSAQELKKMGAKIHIEENKAVITGVNSLRGRMVKASDLRGGAALVLAGLGAQGFTTVTNASIIARGYEDICKDLSSLGANIESSK